MPTADTQSAGPISSHVQAKTVTGLLNIDSGPEDRATLETLSGDICDVLTAHGLVCRIELVNGENFSVRLREVAEEGDILFIGGGDGSILGMAEQAIRLEKELIIAPLGTMNVFADALSLSMDPVEAVQQQINGVPTQIDVGLANGHYFLNFVMIGPFSRLAAAREIIRKDGSLANLGQFAAAGIESLKSTEKMRTTIGFKGKEVRKRLLAAIVSNNPLATERFPLIERPELTTGQLGIYATSHKSLLRTVLSFASSPVKPVTKDPKFDVWISDRTDFRTSAKSMEVLVDGEICELDTPLSLRIVPKALKMRLPAAA